VNQQGPQVTIATLADPKQHRAAAAGVMTWHQAEISRQLAPAFELTGVACTSSERVRGELLILSEDPGVEQTCPMVGER